MFGKQAGWIGLGFLMLAVLVSAGCGKKKQNKTDTSSYGVEDPLYIGGDGAGFETVDLEGDAFSDDGFYDNPLDNPIRPLAQGEKTQVAELQTVYFDFDRSEIRPDQMNVLTGNVDYMLTGGGFSVEIQGHCDERGTPEYNLGLGERRALSVRSYMIDQGVDANRLYTVSYGEEVPAVLGASEDSYSKNRRAEFWMVQM